MKRLFDLLFSILGLITLSPIFLLVAVLIKITSRGSVFFLSDRIGENNTVFKMIKFRTMRVNTPIVATHLLAYPELQITPIGNFLRRTSLDEIPQLLNIVLGNMSIVGPRPALFNQYDLIALRTKHNIHKIKPGLTGWAQVNGRDLLSIEQKVALDRHYLEFQSLPFDVYIIFLTAYRVLSSEKISH
jgi:O-antigen biosynthesis protein WbqP